MHGVELFDWWKTEAAVRLLDPDQSTWYLDQWPGHRSWRASEWDLVDGSSVLTFEALH
jgi:hypothetical protein